MPHTGEYHSLRHIPVNITVYGTTGQYYSLCHIPVNITVYVIYRSISQLMSLAGE